MPSEAGAFLRSRRRRIQPESVGLPHDSKRRTPGLSRSDVATLASVSVQYYTRMEQGGLDGVSDTVLLAIARALQLDDAERQYLLSLALKGSASRFRHPKPAAELRPAVQRMIDPIPYPALVLRLGGDVVAANEPARRVFAVVWASPVQPPNLPRFLFLDPVARDLYADWPAEAAKAVGLLRGRGASSHQADDLAATVAELTAASPEFARLWEDYSLTLVPDGPLCLNHPELGPLSFSDELLILPGDPGHVLLLRVPADEATGTAPAAV